MTILPFRRPGDQRRQTRLSASKDAVIVLGGSENRIPVQITDLSAGGARIALVSETALPETFSLVRGEGDAVKTVNCRLRWQHCKDAGVSFY